MEITDYTAEAEDRFQGTVSYDQDQYLNGYLQHSQGSYNWEGKEGYYAGFAAAEVWNQIHGGFFSLGDNGKCRSKYRWVPNEIMDFDTWMMVPDPNDTPPEYLKLKISASASARACSDTSGRFRDADEEHVTISVSVPENGEAAPGVLSEWNRGDGAVFKVKSSSASNKLVSIATHGAYEVWGPWVKYDAEVSVDGGRFNEFGDEVVGYFSEPLPGEVEVDLGYYAQIDTRSVHITRDGAINETVDDDGTVHGDTTYAYATMNGGYPYANIQTFHSNVTGFVPAISGTWQWTPAGTVYNDPDTWDHSCQRMPDGNPYLEAGVWKGAPTGPSERTIVYNAYDMNDGATATAKYVLKIHDAVEKVDDRSAMISVEGPMWGSDPNGGADDLFVVIGPVPATMKSVTQGRSSSSGWSVALGGEFSFESIKTPLGVTGTYQSSHESNTTATSVLPFDVPAGKYTYPQFQHTYNRHHTTYRHFNPEGEHILTVSNSPYPDDHPYHDMVWDDYVGGDIVWHDPIPTSVTPPSFNPQAPPPILPEP